MKKTLLVRAQAEFAAYQLGNNQPNYARAVAARIAELVQNCAEKGVFELEEVEIKHVRDWLRRTPKATQPGAWKSRHLAAQTFFHWCVFTGLLKPEQNPLATSPRGRTMANKRMLTPTEFRQLLLALPDTHAGAQDKLACLLLWSGCRVNELGNLSISDIAKFPDEVRALSESLLVHREHNKNLALFVNTEGARRMMHGQKLNKRLMSSARRAGLETAERVSGSLLFQSGAFHRLGSTQLPASE